MKTRKAISYPPVERVTLPQFVQLARRARPAQPVATGTAPATEARSAPRMYQVVEEFNAAQKRVA
jgi:hypothetical protein